jgi:hypothetical protein
MGRRSVLTPISTLVSTLLFLSSFLNTLVENNSFVRFSILIVGFDVDVRYKGKVGLLSIRNQPN